MSFPVMNSADISAAGGITTGLDVSYAGPAIDAYAYIQGKLDAAALAVSSNVTTTVMVPSAHFRLSNMLVIPDNVHLVGIDQATSILDVSGVNMLTCLVAVSTQNTRVANLTIIGSGQGSQPANHAGVAPSDVAAAGSGIVFAGVSGGRIENVTVRDCGGTTGVAPYNGVAGIWLTYGCTDCVVQYVSAVNCRNGINQDNYFQASPHGNKIVKNWISGCRFGIADDCDDAAYDTLISGNTVLDCQQSGIDLNKSQKARVTDNHVENCGIENGNHGIWEYGTSSIPAFDNLIKGNVVVGCGVGGTGSGIKSGPYCYYSSIIGNKCVGNAGRGIFIIGQNRYWLVDSNHCRGNALSGFYLYRVDSSNVITSGNLIGNFALNNDQNGFHFDGASEVTVIGNTAKGNSNGAANTYDGFRLTNATTNCEFIGNQSSGGEQRYALVATDSGSTPNTFIGNNFQAGATGRIGFGSLVQNWGDNGDAYITVAGTPTGTYPYGARVYNVADQTLYIRNTSGWTSIGVGYKSTTGAPTETRSLGTLIYNGADAKLYVNSSGGWVVLGEGVALNGSKTYDPTSIASGSQASTTVTVTGAAMGDYVDVSASVDVAGLIMRGYVSSSNTVTVVYANLSGGAVDLASHTLNVRVRKL